MPGARSRLFVDHGPLDERTYARRAGLGWQGKNAMLLAPGVGSYSFLCAILTTAALPPDGPLRKTCGACSRCLPSCPTGALRAPYELVNDLCIAYHTIENRGPVPRDFRPLVGDWVFGCDLCQDACPVNDRPLAAGLPEFAPPDASRATPDLMEILALDEEEFRRRYVGTPVMRARYAGFLRNACIALGNIADRRAVPALAAALSHPEPLVRGHAAWALGRFGAAEALARRLVVENDGWVREELGLALAEARAERRV